jgi:TonB family protein
VFEPTVLEGRPQSVRFGFVAFFGVEDRFHREAGDHRFGFHLLPASTQAQSRAFDVLPSIVSAVNPVFPYEMAVAETRGRAEVVFDLDSTGRVEHMTVVSCDHPELAEALRAMGEACRFTGAFKDRKAIGYQLRRPQDFAPFAEFLSFDSRTKKLLELLRSGGGGIVAVGELDAKPAPIYRPGPVYPQALLAARTAGSAEIEFFIDPDGRAQLPRIVSASQPEFGWAAATAVQQWYYDPPRRQGKPA